MTNIGMNPYTGLPYNQDNFNGITPAAIPVSDQVKDTPAGNAVADIPTSKDEFVKGAPYYTVGICGSLIVKKILEDVCGKKGSFNESRLAKFTDNVATHTNSLNERLVKWINNNKTSLRNFIKEKSPDSAKNFYKNQIQEIVDQTKIGTKPKSSLALNQYDGVKGMAAIQVKDDLKELIGHGKVPEEYAAKLMPILENKDLSDLQIIKNAKASLGEEAFEKLVNSHSATVCERKWTIPLIKKELSLGTKTINLTNSMNKFKGLEAANTENIIAKGIQKSGLIAGEAFSGALICGGGVMGTGGMILNAFMIGAAIKKAIDAPKGEKISTFMESFVGNFFAFLITIPIAEQVLYKALGARNIGTSKLISNAIEKNPELKAKLTAKFAENTTIKQGMEHLAKDQGAYIIKEILAKDTKKAGKLNTKFGEGTTVEDALSHLKTSLLKAPNEKAAKSIQDDIKILDGLSKKAAVDDMKVLKSLSSKNIPILQKVTKSLGRLFSIGLGEEASSHLFSNASFRKRAWNFVTHNVGGLGRLLIIMAVISPVLTKPFEWLTHTIFGTPTATKKEEEKKNKNKDENQQVTNNNTQLNQTNQMNQMQPQVAQNTAQAGTAPASSNSGIVRTYIPSTEPVVLQPQQNAAIQAELAKSDKIIKHYGEFVNNMSH